MKRLWLCSHSYWCCVVLAETEEAAQAIADDLLEKSGEVVDPNEEWGIDGDAERPDGIVVGWT